MYKHGYTGQRKETFQKFLVCNDSSTSINITGHTAEGTTYGPLGEKKCDRSALWIFAHSVASSNLLVLHTRDLNILTVILQYFQKIPNLTDPKPHSLGLMLDFKVQFIILSQAAL